MDYKLIALDVDGTLLNSKKILTEKVFKAVRNLQERNIPVVIATGRPEKGISHIAKELEMEMYGGYVLSYNGGRILDCKNKELIYSSTIPQEYYEEVYEFSKDLNCRLLTYEGDYIITEEPDDEYVAIESNVVKMAVKKVENLLERLTYPVDKFLLVGEPSYMGSVVDKVKEKFKGKLNVFQSEPFFIEIVPDKIDKANSLGMLLEKWGMTREHLVACGDGRNDVTMIDFAGMGVAMKNACEEVLSVADYVADSNDEDGVAKVIEKFFK